METIDEKTGARLLGVAREAISAAVQVRKEETPQGEEPWPEMERRGVFVTLRKAGRLRGCIGTFSPTADLPQTVADIAVAATHDPRFVGNRISAAEFKDIRIELSVLSPLQRISDPVAFERGRHGVQIRYGTATGCFLPDVGVDLGWDKETFLSELCRQKAGLSPDAWRDKQAEVYVFTVQKFAE